MFKVIMRFILLSKILITSSHLVDLMVQSQMLFGLVLENLQNFLKFGVVSSSHQLKDHALESGENTPMIPQGF